MGNQQLHNKVTTLAEADAIQEGALFAKHQKVYPRAVHGLFARWRVLGVVCLLGIYYILPWISWNERQAVLFDLPHRQFHIFGLTFWPQDFIYLTIFLIIAAVALFFFTALAGRIWCGYACPQTVWTEIFLWMERKIEGTRNQQIKLDGAKWSWRKLRIKFTKQFAWIAFSAFTGFTFVGYFTPIIELWQSLANFSLGPWEGFWIGFYGLATYGNAGFLREQVCTYMCPYARFQSAMFDSNTLIIAFDESRGEPRGSRSRQTNYQAQGLGDCINCTLCVQVCPTGIDIRDGLQYECIGCAACIDVCDDVMEKMDYPKGLIRYTTQNGLAGQPTRLLRPRIVMYSLLLAVLIIGLAFLLSTRKPIQLEVMRDRNTLYNETSDGLVENIFTLKILNMDKVKHNYTVHLTGLEEAHTSLKGNLISVEPGEVRSVPIAVQIDPVHLDRVSYTVYFVLQSKTNAQLTTKHKSRFIGPRGTGS